MHQPTTSQISPTGGSGSWQPVITSVSGAGVGAQWLTPQPSTSAAYIDCPPVAHEQPIAAEGPQGAETSRSRRRPRRQNPVVPSYPVQSITYPVIIDGDVARANRSVTLVWAELGATVGQVPVVVDEMSAQNCISWDLYRRLSGTGRIVAEWVHPEEVNFVWWRSPNRCSSRLRVMLRMGFPTVGNPRQTVEHVSTVFQVIREWHLPGDQGLILGGLFLGREPRLQPVEGVMTWKEMRRKRMRTLKTSYHPYIVRDCVMTSTQFGTGPPESILDWGTGKVKVQLKWTLPPFQVAADGWPEATTSPLHELDLVRLGRPLPASTPTPYRTLPVQGNYIP